MTQSVRYRDELKAVADELILTTPEWWKEATLSLAYSVQGQVTSCAHTITSEEWKDVVVATDDLMETTRVLSLCFVRANCPLKSAVIRIRQLEDEKWHFVADFKYL